MKQAKNLLIVAVALLFTVTIVGSIWCQYTPSGQKWHKQWQGENGDQANFPKASLN